MICIGVDTVGASLTPLHINRIEPTGVCGAFLFMLYSEFLNASKLLEVAEYVRVPNPFWSSQDGACVKLTSEGEPKYKFVGVGLSTDPKEKLFNVILDTLTCLNSP